MVWNEGGNNQCQELSLITSYRWIAFWLCWAPGSMLRPKSKSHESFSHPVTNASGPTSSPPCRTMRMSLLSKALIGGYAGALGFALEAQTNKNIIIPARPFKKRWAKPAKSYFESRPHTNFSRPPPLLQESIWASDPICRHPLLVAWHTSMIKAASCDIFYPSLE